jgi:hypothetical protein
MGRVNGQNISIGIIANQGIYSPPLYVLRKGRAGIEKVEMGGNALMFILCVQ